MTLTPASSVSGGGGGGGVVDQGLGGASPWLVSGPLTDAQLAARLPLGVTGPLTDAQLAARLPLGVAGTVALDAPTLAALEVIGLDAATLAALETISVANFPAVQPVSDNGGSLTVDGPLTDAQLRAAVVPVGDGGGSLTVDGTVAVTQSTTPWKAREDTAAMAWASVKSAAPGIGAVQATTGALAAGDYDFDIYLMASDTVAVGKGLVIEHRNAADGATLQNLGGCDAPDCIEVRVRRYTLAANERIRIIAGTAAGAAASMYVSAIGRRVA